MKRGRGGVLIGFAFSALLLSGCTHDPTRPIGAPVLDSQFGDAVKRARAMQVINPEGAAASDQGYSGKAAQRAIERHDGRAVPSAPPASAPLPDTNGNGKGAK